MRIKLIVLALFSSLFFLCPSAAWTQATTSLSGHVMDSAGASVAGANITLMLAATGTVRKGKTNKSGDYQFSQLLPGRYDLTVVSPGFATSKKTGLDLLVSQPATVNVALTVATVASEVTVNADSQP
ncbi:MAG: carboxypeptidase-like regulatory domain-containing protein, partial [Bryocella sp.]